MPRSKVKIPESTINRLSMYLRVFSQVSRDDHATISSKTLAELAGIKPEQVRKDLAYFGQFGRRGVGYPVAGLKERIATILGINRDWNVAVVGVGHLGTSLLMYQGFANLRFKIVAGFDNDPDKISWELEGVRIHDMRDLPEVAAEKNIRIAILTVPRDSAQEAAAQIAGAGIPSILNFTPAQIKVSKKVLVRNVDLTAELEAMTYALR